MKWFSLSIFLLFSLLVGGCQTLTALEPPPPETTLSQPQKTATVAAKPMSTVKPTIVTDIAATVIASSDPRIDSSFSSPDKKWKVEIVSYSCTKVDPRENADAYAVELLRLIRISDQKEFIAESNLQSCGGIGAAGLGGLYWSRNSLYFYYTEAREGVPDGCGYWMPPIKRFDVANQKVEEIGKGHLSPEKTRLAFWWESEIVIWSLDDGEIARIPVLVQDVFENQIAWSPDGDSIVYLQTDLECQSFGMSYITKLDLIELKQTLLVESETPTISWLSWDDPDQLTIVDFQGDQWRFDLFSNELTRVP